jgi:hypothetical protein
MRRATEKGRSDGPVPSGLSGVECIHCHHQVGLQAPSSKAHASNAFDFDTTTDSRTVSTAETSLISPIEEVSEAPDYGFLFDTSMDEFLSPFEENYMTKYTNDQTSSPSHKKPVVGLVSLLGASNLGDVHFNTRQSWLHLHPQVMARRKPKINGKLILYP